MSFGTLKTVTIDRDGVFVDINETDLKETDVVVAEPKTSKVVGETVEAEAHEINDALAKPKTKTRTKR